MLSSEENEGQSFATVSQRDTKNAKLLLHHRDWQIRFFYGNRGRQKSREEAAAASAEDAGFLCTYKAINHMYHNLHVLPLPITTERRRRDDAAWVGNAGARSRPKMRKEES